MKPYIIPFLVAALAMAVAPIHAAPRNVPSVPQAVSALAGAPIQAAQRNVLGASQEEFPLPERFTGGYEKVDGVKLHFVRGGQGPLALLVHGFGQTWYEWNRLMPQLAERYTVVAVELPGLGQSEPPQ